MIWSSFIWSWTKECRARRTFDSLLFIEKAREIEADEEHSAADKLMGRLAKTGPDPQVEQKK